MKGNELLFAPFSPKQLAVLTWWCRTSPFCSYDSILCDGAVRSGKTMCMSLSFIAWAFHQFSGVSFAICGKTIASLRRNVVQPLLPVLRALGFSCTEKLSQHYLEISRSGRQNRFYLFGGRDESSASLIQGMTLGGVLLDEVALMPRSFVEQALARCSMEGSKFWFNCNPEHPQHWFYEEWVLRAREKNCLYLHFTMRDNPSLSPAMLARYESLYSGAFYERFVEGKWAAAQGLVYPMFGSHITAEPPQGCTCFYLSCDYGTVNPFSCGLWGEKDGVWYRLREYYYDSRREGAQKTDEEYYAEIQALAGDLPVRAVIVDPSAASFLACIRRHGRYPAIPAQNEVLDGIRQVSDALREGRLRVAPCCRDTIREFGLYRWDARAAKDLPRKEHDHAMDDIRYFVTTVLAGQEEGFYALAAARR